MKVGDTVKIKHRTHQSIGVITAIYWERTSNSPVIRWEKKHCLIQCEDGRARALIADLEKA